MAVASGFGTSLKDKVQKEFPNTPITSADCDKGPANLCEVVAGSNVFYVTRDAKFAFVGAVLDLENKVDVTDVRLRELAAVGQAEARIRGAAPAAPGRSGRSGRGARFCARCAGGQPDHSRDPAEGQRRRP